MRSELAVGGKRSDGPELSVERLEVPVSLDHAAPGTRNQIRDLDCVRAVNESA